MSNKQKMKVGRHYKVTVIEDGGPVDYQGEVTKISYGNDVIYEIRPKNGDPFPIRESQIGNFVENDDIDDFIVEYKHLNLVVYRAESNPNIDKNAPVGNIGCSEAGITIASVTERYCIKHGISVFNPGDNGGYFYVVPRSAIK